MELAPLLAAKKELGEGEGLADRLQLDQDLPPDDCLDWRELNFSYLSLACGK